MPQISRRKKRRKTVQRIIKETFGSKNSNSKLVTCHQVFYGIGPGQSFKMEKTIHCVQYPQKSR